MKTLDISSKDNPTFKKYKNLLTSKGIKEEKMFLLMGEKLINDFLNLKNSAFRIKSVLTFEGKEFPIVQSQIKLKKELFNEIDTLGTHYPILVLEYQDFEALSLKEIPSGLEIITPLGDPKNLGALARTAAAFGVSRLILTHDSCHPFLPHTIKASAGSILNLEIRFTPFKMNQILITGENFALDLKGQNLNQIKWPKNLRLLIGEEGPGIELTPDQLKKVKLVNIPTSKNVESLNAAVSAALAIWEWSKQQT